MRVLALSGSPRKVSFSDKMLDAFIQGMGEGVELVKFFPHEMQINHCLSCWSCWKQTRGVCAQKDDMRKILRAVENCEIILLAAPLYVDGFPSHLKKVFDRLLPLLKGSMVVDKENHSRHPRRNQKEQKAVLISACGFPERDNFDPLFMHFRALCKNAGWVPSGSIFVSAAGASKVPSIARKLKTIKAAGKAFIELGEVPYEIEEEISREVINRDLYRALVTARFEGKPFEIVKGFFSAVKTKLRK